jgi:hypothetical protein
MSAHGSVMVQQSEDYPLVRMTCETTIEVQDLKEAYNDVTHA